MTINIKSKFNFDFFKRQELDNKNNNFIEFAKIFIITLIEIVLIIILFPFLFESNDDSFMNSIVSGAISGTPSEYIIFTNIIIGKILKHFFILFPTINWYTWYLILSFFAGYLSIQYCFNKIRSDFWVKVIRHLLILSVIIFSLLILQFTRISAISLIGGLLLLLFSSKKSYSEVICGVFLIVLGSAIRFDVFLMCIVLVMPFIIILIINKNKRKILYFSLAISLVLLTTLYDYLAYKKAPEYYAYRQFNELRSKITTHDNPSFTYNNKKEITKKIGWTETDFKLASNFNIDIGHPKFTTEKLIQITNDSQSFISKTFSITFIIKLKETFLKIKVFLSEKNYFIFYCFLLLFFFQKRWKEIFTMSLYFLFIAMLAFYLYYYLDGNPKVRVLYGLFLPLFLLSIYYFDLENIVNKKALSLIRHKIIMYTLVILALLAVSLPLLSYAKASNQILNKRIRSHKINNFIQTQKDKFYVSWIGLTYDPFKLPYKQENVYTLGWLAGSPFNKNKIEKYTGLKGIGIYSIYEKELVWYFSNNAFYNDNKFNELVSNFYFTNYTSCSLKKEKYSISEKDTIYKLVFFIPKQNTNNQ